MFEIELRYQKVSDAKRFFEILSNPNFKFFRVSMKSVNDEIKFLKQNALKRKKNLEYNYTILCDGDIVGGCGIKINQHRIFIGEIGYFIDEAYWGRGIVVEAVKKLEKIGFNQLSLARIEIVIEAGHKMSEKVAIKCGYKKEGIMRKSLKYNDRYFNECLYAKVKK